MMRPGIITAVLLLLYAPVLRAQNMDTGSAFKESIKLDSFVVSSGFDVNAFIRRVRTDTTFYKAFRSMHLVAYTAANEIKMYNKRGDVDASLASRTRQKRVNGCRNTEVLQEQVTGNFYERDGDYRYYTAELFAHLFFAKAPVCGETDIVAGAMDMRGKGKLEKSKYELKQLIFNPGARVSGVPFMGDRASIFEPGEAEKYDFSISREQHDGVDCYRFRITPKPGNERKVVYNELTTWFRRSDYSIVARDYSVSYKTLVYDFDVQMKVRTAQVAGKLCPTHIDYNGDWHIFTRKRERGRFVVDIAY